MSNQIYRVTTDAWIDGRLHEANSAIAMTSHEAKYWLLAGTLVEAPTSVDSTPLSVDQSTPVVDKLGRKTRE